MSEHCFRHLDSQSHESFRHYPGCGSWDAHGAEYARAGGHEQKAIHASERIADPDSHDSKIR